MLFPQLETHEELQQNGQIIKYHVDKSVDSNLDAALIDLQDGKNDQIVHGTINSTIKRLINVRRMLEAYPKLDKDAKYIIVDDESSDEDIEASTKDVD